MSTQGARIRNAREKLGLTQEEFAKRCGVHRRSQVNYELGKRLPGEAYLDALDAMGIDSIYIMSGEHRFVYDQYPTLSRYLLICLLEAIGYTEDDALMIIHEFEVSIKKITNSDESSSLSDNLTREFAARAFSNSPVVAKMLSDAANIDPDVLGNVLNAVESELATQSVLLSTEKRGRLVATVYRDAKDRGRIDTRMLVDAVALAK